MVFGAYGSGILSLGAALLTSAHVRAQAAPFRPAFFGQAAASSRASAFAGAVPCRAASRSSARRSAVVTQAKASSTSSCYANACLSSSAQPAVWWTTRRAGIDHQACSAGGGHPGGVPGGGHLGRQAQADGDEPVRGSPDHCLQGAPRFAGECSCTLKEVCLQCWRAV